MADVDPFQHPIPIAFMRDDELRHWCEYLHEHLFQNWVRTGGGDDAISNADVQEKYSWELAPKAEESVTGLPSSTVAIERDKFNAVSVTTSYTSCDYEFINCSNPITITLPYNPCENSVIIIRNSDGSQVTIDGNSKNINGESDALLRAKNSSIVFHYFIDSDEWFTR